MAGVPNKIDGVGQIRVLVIDDGSTDDTAGLARRAGAEVVQHRTNEGLGSSFQEDVRLAIENKADILVNIDGDGQFDPGDIPKLVGPIVNRKADMASASRFLDRDLVPEMPAVKKWGNRAVARVVWLLTGKRFRDVSCGFRAFSREALLRMNLFGSFTYTQESFLDLAFKELKLLEVPVQVRGTREFGESRIASSIPRYAVRSLLIMLRAFISYKPFRLFFCHIAGIFRSRSRSSHFSFGPLPDDREVHSAHLGGFCGRFVLLPGYSHFGDWAIGGHSGPDPPESGEHAIRHEKSRIGKLGPYRETSTPKSKPDGLDSEACHEWKRHRQKPIHEIPDPDTVSA